MLVFGPVMLSAFLPLVGSFSCGSFCPVVFSPFVRLVIFIMRFCVVLSSGDETTFHRDGPCSGSNAHDSTFLYVNQLCFADQGRPRGVLHY